MTNSQVRHPDVRVDQKAETRGALSPTRVEVKWHDTDIAFVTLHGEHDLNTRPELTKALTALVRSGEQVVVDLSVVEFIDSTVLNALVAADDLAARRASTFTILVDDASRAQRVLEISNLLDVLMWAETRDDAIAAARQRRNGGGMFRKSS